MTPTELAAEKWLHQQGCHVVVFRRQDTPDFITDKGGFEVKLLNGNRLQFYKGQLDKLRNSNSTILVYEEGSSCESLPVAVVQIQDIEESPYRYQSAYHTPRMCASVILETIQQKPRMTPSMIAEETKLNPGVVRNVLVTLTELGLVTTPARGIYEITPFGLDALKERKDKK